MTRHRLAATWAMGALLLALGASNADAQATFTLGNLVWEDNNGNGLREASEPGIAAAVVELLSSGTVVATTTTDAAGTYSFTGLAAGTYAVRVNLAASAPGANSLFNFYASTLNLASSFDPANLVDNDDNGVVSDIEPPGTDDDPSLRTFSVTTAPFALASDNLTVDFGLRRRKVSLGNLVWLDANNNGLRDAGEPGIPGVTVRLLYADGSPVNNPPLNTDPTVEDRITDANGFYLFPSLFDDSYRVQVTVPPGFVSSTDIASSPTPNNDIDNDDNGVEPSTLDGLPAVTSGIVTLLRFTEPTTEDGNNQTNLTVDFGFFQPTLSLGNLVWLDSNDNALRDAGEPGIDGIEVRLYTAGGTTPIRTTTTAGGGLYLFAGLSAGDYIVEVVAPAGLTSSTDIPSSATPNNDIDNDDNGTVLGVTTVRSGIVTLALGTEPIDDGDTDPNSNLTIDFGFFAPEEETLALGNLVWRDNNNNGVVDGGEPGIGGVSVRLISGDGSTVLATTTTSATGIYGFANLAPGSYIVEVVTPAGLASSTDIATSATPNNDVDNDDNGTVLGAGTVRSAPVTLAFGTEPTDDGDTDPNTNLTIDFGFFPIPPPVTVSLGNLVWRDSNGNGIDDPTDNNGVVDPGEPGIAGVTVRLFSGDGATQLATTVTNASGNYLFAGLAPGSYIVRVDGPGGFLSSTDPASGATPNNDIDNDDNGIGQGSGLVSSGVVTLAVGTEPINDGDTDPNSNLTVDFGFWRSESTPPPELVSVGNLVWNDANNNGVRDAGEAGIPGVVVRLFTNGTLVATTTTNGSGNYLFSGLAPGDYLLEVVQPAACISSVDISTSFNPNNDVDNDDNGVDLVPPVVRSRVVSLAPGAEPVNDGDTDPNSNLTVDFGFFCPPPDVSVPDVDLQIFNQDVDYFLQPTNLGSVPYGGTLTVMYILPDALENHMHPFGTGWACRVDGQVVTCTYERGLDPGQSGSFTVWTGALVPGPATSTAFIDVPGDLNVSNNVASITIPDANMPKADVSITATGPATGNVGNLLTYRLTVRNNGPAVATAVNVVHFLRPGLVFDSVTTDRGSCPNPRFGVLHCTIASLASGAEAHVNITMSPASAGLYEPAFFATSANVADSTLSNNAAVLATNVATSGGLALSLPPTDNDADGMPDEWERMMGLNPNIADGSDDLDGDGVSNAGEYAAGTHPNGRHRQYFAEGVTNELFATSFALLAPDARRTAHVLLRFLRPDGTALAFCRTMAGMSQATVTSRDAFGRDAVEFATVIESDVPIIAERTTTWGAGGYGTHAEAAMARQATEWYLAEGATLSGMQLFYLLQNPSATDATVEITYMREAPEAPVVRNYTVRANSRLTVWANLLLELQHRSVSARVRSLNGVAIGVERALYRDAPGQPWGAGHDAAGVTEPSLTWQFGEGATGGYFDMFMVMANPGVTEARVTAEYRRTDGQIVTRQYRIAPMSRYTVWVDQEPGLDNTSMGVTLMVDNGVPIVAERVMWWPGLATTWHEAHVSSGATSTGTLWATSDGITGASAESETYVLVSNASASPGQIKVTLSFQDGSMSARTFAIGANARFTVDTRVMFPESAGRRFGALVESIGASPVPIIVERSTYSSASFVRWAAGTNVLGTRVR